MISPHVRIYNLYSALNPMIGDLSILSLLSFTINISSTLRINLYATKCQMDLYCVSGIFCISMYVYIRISLKCYVRYARNAELLRLIEATAKVAFPRRMRRKNLRILKSLQKNKFIFCFICVSLLTFELSNINLLNVHMTVQYLKFFSIL